MVRQHDAVQEAQNVIALKLSEPDVDSKDP